MAPDMKDEKTMLESIRRVKEMIRVRKGGDLNKSAIL